MIRGVIFDFDGVIYDSTYIWNNIGEIYLRSKGKIPEKNLPEKIKNMNLDMSSEYFRKNYNFKTSSEKIKSEILKIFEKTYVYDTKLKQGVLNLLEKLKKLNIKMIIASSSEKSLVEKSLKINKIGYFFEKIITCTEVGKNKDYPDIYEKSLDFLGLEKNEVVVFEDAIHAIKTCKKEGFTVIGVKDISEKDQEKVKLISNFYLSDYSNLEKLINFLNKGDKK